MAMSGRFGEAVHWAGLGLVTVEGGKVRALGQEVGQLVGQLPGLRRLPCPDREVFVLSKFGAGESRSPEAQHSRSKQREKGGCTSHHTGECPVPGREMDEG